MQFAMMWSIAVAEFFLTLVGSFTVGIMFYRYTKLKKLFSFLFCSFRLAIYKRHACGEKNWSQERNCKATLNLAREYYGDNKLRKRDAGPTKLVDFEGIVWHHNVNVMLYKPKKDRGKTNIICSGGKLKHILNSYEKVFYDGDTKFSYAACQWIEAQVIKTGKHIHQKMW